MKKENVWVGIEDLTNNPKFTEASKQEFFDMPLMEALSEENDVIEQATKGTSRRDFLKYLGFGLGAATVAASCEIPIRKAVPYVVKPDAIVPGVAAFYATSFVKGGDYCSVLVKTREGRPIKVEGNSLSPITKGGTSARAQASVLDLYNTSRIRFAGRVTKNGKRIERLAWEDFDKALMEESGFQPTSNIRIVSHTNMSPSVKQLIADFTIKFPNTKVVTYDPVSATGMLLANEVSFGKRVIPAYHFDKAKVIVNYGADFLGTWISPVEYAVDFSKGRKIKDAHHPEMSRLIQFESGMSLTGSNADNRVHIKPSETGTAIISLYNEVAKLAGLQAVGGAAKLNDKASKATQAVAKDLWAAKGSALVIAGSNDVNEQIVVNAINAMLGNYGTTITFEDFSNQRQGIDADVQGLIQEMASGKVGAVLVLGDANPCYDIPNASKFAEALGKAKVSVSFTGVVNETSANCKYIAPDHHYLESWGDVEVKNGQFSLIQPTIRPLFETRSFITSMLTWMGNDVSKLPDADLNYIKTYWNNNLFGKQSDFVSFQSFWDNSLHDGVFNVPTAAPSAVVFSGDVASAASKIAKPSTAALEFAFYEPVGVGSGVYANNPWLQEMPDPITRVSWDNPVLVPIKWDGNSKYASLNNLKDGDLADVTIGDKTNRFAVVAQFGQMEGTVSIALGYGRTVAGAAGKFVGKNVYEFLATKNGTTQYYITTGEVSGKKGEDKEFACVQHHHTFGVSAESKKGKINVDEEILGYQGSLTNRSIIYAADVADLHEKVEIVKEKRAEAQELNSQTLYSGHENLYKQGHHWAMGIDMTACIGCGACQVACVAENNVPIVGKREVSRHHEMTWLRIDRYYYGDVENPNVVYQPMMCQHCDNAPCENVCPVNATNHSSEGLNQMTYNRCIGTRYCANNCPYKVRRFNWLDYTSADLFPWNEPEYKEDLTYMTDDLTRMVLNPDVTVRSRGVIEKCSFCVQRIQEAKLTAKVEKRKLVDSDLKTACQSACPTGAIVFGDSNNPNSAVSKFVKNDTNYILLEEINVQASVNYLMRVTNKNESIG